MHPLDISEVFRTHHSLIFSQRPKYSPLICFKVWESLPLQESKFVLHIFHGPFQPWRRMMKRRSLCRVQPEASDSFQRLTILGCNECIWRGVTEAQIWGENRPSYLLTPSSKIKTGVTSVTHWPLLSPSPLLSESSFLMKWLSLAKAWLTSTCLFTRGQYRYPYFQQSSPIGRPSHISFCNYHTEWYKYRVACWSLFDSEHKLSDFRTYLAWIEAGRYAPEVICVLRFWQSWWPAMPQRSWSRFACLPFSYDTALSHTVLDLGGWRGKKGGSFRKAARSRCYANGARRVKRSGVAPSHSRSGQSLRWGLRRVTSSHGWALGARPFVGMMNVCVE